MSNEEQQRLEAGFDLRSFHCPACLGAISWPHEDPFTDKDCATTRIPRELVILSVFSRRDGRLYEMPLSEPLAAKGEKR